jgi:hypothetical protein
LALSIEKANLCSCRYEEAKTSDEHWKPGSGFQRVEHYLSNPRQFFFEWDLEEFLRNGVDSENLLKSTGVPRDWQGPPGFNRVLGGTAYYRNKAVAGQLEKKAAVSEGPVALPLFRFKVTCSITHPLGTLSNGWYSAAAHR